MIGIRSETHLVSRSVRYIRLIYTCEIVSVLNYLSTMPWRRTGAWRCSSISFDLRTRWTQVVSYTHLSLYPPPPGERATGSHWVGGWVNLCVGLNPVGETKILHCRDSPTDRPAYSPSLYQLNHPEYLYSTNCNQNWNSWTTFRETFRYRLLTHMFKGLGADVRRQTDRQIERHVDVSLT
jgi:hypothetical protein